MQTKALCLLVFVSMFDFSCKKRTYTDARSQNTKGSDKAFNLVTSEYTYTPDSDSFQLVGSSTVEVAPLPDTPPDANILLTLPISTAMIDDLQAVGALILYVTGKGHVWSLGNNGASPYTKEGCHPYALIIEDSYPILISTEDFERIENILVQIDPAFSIYSAGQLCLDASGFITEVNNKSAIGFPQTSNANFQDIFEPQTVYTDVNTEIGTATDVSAVPGLGLKGPTDLAPRVTPLPRPIVIGARTRPHTPPSSPRPNWIKAEPGGDIKLPTQPSTNLLKMGSGKTSVAKTPGITLSLSRDHAKSNLLLGLDETTRIKTFNSLREGLEGRILPGKENNIQRRIMINDVGTLTFLAESQSKIFKLTLANGKTLALKEFREGTPTFREFDHERSMLAHANDSRARKDIPQDNVVHYYGSFAVKNELGGQSKFIAMEFADGGDITKAKEGVSIDEDLLAIADVTRTLHGFAKDGKDHPDQAMLSNDLKGPNFLRVDKKLKAADFGTVQNLATLKQSGGNRLLNLKEGTQLYYAPERTEVDAVQTFKNFSVFRNDIANGKIDLVHLAQEFKKSTPPTDETRALYEGLLNKSDEDLGNEIKKAAGEMLGKSAIKTPNNLLIDKFLGNHLPSYNQWVKETAIEKYLGKENVAKYDVRSSEIPSLGLVLYQRLKGIDFMEKYPDASYDAGSNFERQGHPDPEKVQSKLQDEINTLEKIPTPDLATRKEIEYLKLIQSTWNHPFKEPKRPENTNEIYNRIVEIQK